MEDSNAEWQGNQALPCDITLLTSCFNEVDSLEEFYVRVVKAMNTLDRPYNMVFVDDGSTDGTYEKLTQLFERDENVRAVISLAQNMGQAKAMTAGYPYLDGRALLIMDSDLQLNPEEIPLLIREYDKGYDLVCAWRKRRTDSVFRQIGSRVIRRILWLFSPIRLHDFGCTFMVINMQIIHSFGLGPFQEVRPTQILASIPNWSEVVVSHSPRKHGKSGWTPVKLFGRAMNVLLDVLLCRATAIFWGALALYFAVAFYPLAAFGISDGAVNRGVVMALILCNMWVSLGICVLLGLVVKSVGVALPKHPAYIVRDVKVRDGKRAHGG